MKTAYFKIDEPNTGRIWYCKTEEHKNKIIARLEKLGYKYEVTIVYR